MKEYSNKELEKLYKQAKGGDFRAEKELREINRDYVKKANRRLESLEKADKDYYAYDTATAYTRGEFDSNRYRYDFISLPTVEDLYESLRSARTFLSSKTSTIRGQRAIENQRIETFRNMGIEIPRDRDSIRLFNEFLRDEDMMLSLKEVYGSNEVLGLLANALAPRRTRRKRLEDFVNSFAKSSDDAFKLLRSFGSAYRYDYDDGRFYHEDD